MVYLVFIAALIVIFISMYKSGHIVKSVFLSAAQGLSSLFAVNFIGGFISIHLPLNVFTSAVCVAGGMPGVIFLLIYDIFAKI